MKDRTILAIKGLAIIGVVFHHIANRRLTVEAGDWMKETIFLFDWCVLAFFCVSGYLQAMSDAKKHRSFVEFTRVRFARLVVPWVLLALLYTCLWQVVQALHIPNIGVHVPPSFVGKLEDVFWPLDSTVAQQLYFFPILFAVSIVLVVVQLGLGVNGMWAAAWTSGVVGLAYFPHFFTGFSWGVFVWAICFYAGGYLLFHYRAKRPDVRVVLIAVTAVVIFFSGAYGIIRCIPFWLLVEGATIRLDRAPLLGRLGDASGTIYIYHTPFIIMPLAISASYLPGPVAQFAGLLLAAAIAIAICCVLFEQLQKTRAKFLLM
jgi:hypothetical protein